MFASHGHRLCRDIVVVLIASIAIWIPDIFIILYLKLETGDLRDLKYGVYRITLPLTSLPLPLPLPPPLPLPLAHTLRVARRETESKLQTWSFNPTSSGSRTWPKEEIEQSIDLRVDGIPNDETYKDEQYMQRIADQVQKLVNTERFIK